MRSAVGRRGTSNVDGDRVSCGWFAVSNRRLLTALLARRHLHYMSAFNRRLPKDDDNDQLLNVSEGYRKAKRNVLFWAAVTLLLALAANTGSDGVELAPIVRGLGFSQKLMISLSLIVLVFMLIGYRRAEWHLTLRNSPFAYSKVMERAADEAEALRAEIEKKRKEFAQLHKMRQESVESAQASIEQIKKLHGASVREFREEASRCKSSFLDELSRALELMKCLKANPTQNALSIAGRADYVSREEITKMIDDRIAKAGNLINQFGAMPFASGSFTNLAEAGWPFPNTSPEESDMLDEKGALVVSDLREFVQRMRGLSDEISGADRIYFRWYDQRVVYATSAIAAGVAIWRLVDENSLLNTLSFWGLIPAVAI